MKTATIEEILATRYRVDYRYRVNFDVVGYSNKNLMNQWCEERCRGRWRSETHFALYWQFEDENDAMMFNLRWGTADGNKMR
jgi:hypothetical protein